MSKRGSFRFAIADDALRSECWSLFTNGDDVYLTSNAHKRALKVSLHRSGICQIALLEGFFEEHVEWREDRPEFRSILRWKRLPSPDEGAQIAASILFASYEFWPEQEAVPRSKSYIPLPPPPDMYARVVDIAFGGQDPAEAAEIGGWTDELLHSFRLPNGEFVCLVQRLERLPEGFFDFAPQLSPYALTLGIDEADLHDARGISVFYCMHRREGHADIRSLHNMRAATVPAEDL